MRKDFEILLYKNKLNTKTLIDLLPQLSSTTVKSLMKDLGLERPQKQKNDSDADTIYAFTDGGCLNNGKRGAIAGYSVFFTEDEDSVYYPFNTTKQIITDPTNNKAELSGIKYVFKTIDENRELFNGKKVVICTDSMYSINCIEKWCVNWEKNGWRNAKGEPVKNKELIQKILEFKSKCKDIPIQFKHVFSHVKEPEDKDSLQYKLWYGNDYVDRNISILFQKK